MSATNIFILILLIAFLIWVFSLQFTEPQGAFYSPKSMNSQTSNINTISKNIKNLKNYQSSNMIYSHNNNYALSIDNTNNKICIANTTTTKLYDYSDLLAAELIKDGESITKSERGSQVVGAVIGGILLGGAGAVIGGLSGKKTTTEVINSLELKLTFSNSTYGERFTFFRKTNKNDDTKSYIYKANRWMDLMNTIILKTEKENHENSHKKIDPAPSNSFSIADEITKLKTLKDDGIITNAEFDAQKSKLLT